MTASLVWYASYGSNMARERFNAYLMGGKPRGARRRYLGCRDKSPALDTVRVSLPGGIFYAASSQVWGGGGAAFWDPSLSGEVTARAWLITLEQFSDVLTQENGGEPARDRELLDPRELFSKGSLLLDDLLYGKAVVAGNIAGVPLVTFTSAAGEADAARADLRIAARRFSLNPPSDAYREMLDAGARETSVLRSEQLDLNGTANLHRG